MLLIYKRLDEKTRKAIFPNFGGTKNPRVTVTATRGENNKLIYVQLTKNKSEISERSYYLSTFTRKLKEMLQIISKIIEK